MWPKVIVRLQVDRAMARRYLFGRSASPSRVWVTSGAVRSRRSRPSRPGTIPVQIGQEAERVRCARGHAFAAPNDRG